MHRFALAHLSDGNLRQSSLAAHSVERSNAALAVAHLGEVEARGIHLEWGFGSLCSYATEELRLSADAAYNRIRVARKAREFPVLFDELAAGSLHLASILLLAPRLTRENGEQLIRMASGKSRSEIEALLFASGSGTCEPALFDTGVTRVPGRVETGTSDEAPATTSPRAEGVARSTSPSRTLPFGILPSTREKLARLRDLLAHQVPSGNLALVLDRACDIALREIERRKFGATIRPRRARESKSARYIPAAVRRAVRARDGDRCAFVSADDHRCSCRSRLEFDHIVPVALGGKSTVDNVRLLCRAHNQFVAEKVFGAELIAERRRVARERVASKKGGVTSPADAGERPAMAVAPAAASVVASPPNEPPVTESIEDSCTVEEVARRVVEERTRLLLSGLRELGYGVKEAREAAEFGVGDVDRSLEDQMKRALSWFRPRTMRPRE